MNKKVHFPRNGIFTEVAAKKGTLFRKRFFMPNLFNNQTFNSFVNYCFSENWFPTKSKLVSCLIKSGLEKKIWLFIILIFLNSKAFIDRQTLDLRVKPQVFMPLRLFLTCHLCIYAKGSLDDLTNDFEAITLLFHFFLESL